MRESDIVENFDPSDDPNQQPATPNAKKKRASRSSIANTIGSKVYESAIEEGKWALEEFELQLQDFENDETEDNDGEEMNYSYSVLCQSDEEADEEIAEEDDMPHDVDECNELLATDGLIDFSSLGRKNAKKRAQAMKKQKADAEKKQKADKAKKLKAEQSKKKKDAQSRERELKKEQKDLERKRKKRSREREKALKGSEQKNKKRRVSDSEDLKKSASGRRNLIAGKRERATAIVEGYVNRATDKGDYKSLCLGGGQIPGGGITIPASLIDSSGIFGMALAFRAAAGEIQMPDESGDQQANVKPWDAIKLEDQKKSQDREKLIEKQISLLEKEIERVKSNTAKRLELAKEARSQHKEMIEKIVTEDKTARQNPLAKTKKVTPEKVKRKLVQSLDKVAQEGKSENGEANAENETEAKATGEEKPQDGGDETEGKVEMDVEPVASVDANDDDVSQDANAEEAQN